MSDLNFNIITGKLNKRVKSCNPARPWGPEDFFLGIGYHTHNRRGPAEDQSFFWFINILMIFVNELTYRQDRFSIHASQLVEHEALARKIAAAFSNALSIAKYVYDQPEISEESKAGLHHLKLDLVADSNFAWRKVHNNMLMCCSVALNNLSRTIPPIDSNQKVALLQSQQGSANSSTVFPAPAASSQTYSTKPYTAVAGLLGRVVPPIGEWQRQRSGYIRPFSYNN